MLRQLPPIGTRWPDTCNLCGAPLMNRRCPRCGYERAKQGQSVFTGVHGETGIVVGPRIVALGAASGLGTSVTIPQVTVPADWMLIVFGGISGDTSQIDATLMTWGGTQLGSSNRIYNFDSTLYVDTQFLLVTPALAGTKDLVITNSDAHREVLFGVANRVSGPRNFRQVWTAQSATPVAQASLVIVQDLADVEFYPIWVKNAVSDPGAWSSNGEVGQSLAIGGSFAAGHISTFIGNTGQSGSVTVTKALSPSAAYFMPATEYLNP